MTVTITPLDQIPLLSVHTDASEVTPQEVAAADALWHIEQATRPSLFDGLCLDVVSISDSEVVCRAVPYRFVLASIRSASDPNIKAGAIRALAVTGAVCLADGRVVVGLRAQHVTQDPNRWELTPSGGVDRTEPRAVTTQLLQELAEELGVTASEVTQIVPLARAVDDLGCTVDIACLIRTALDEDQVLERFRQVRAQEHSEIMVVSPLDDRTIESLDLTAVSRSLLAVIAERQRA